MRKRLDTRARLALAFLLLGSAALVQAGTLDDVRERGLLRCGVSMGVPGFSMPDDKGVWEGIDVDLCRAVAAAVLGDAQKVEFVPLSTQARLSALRSGGIDVLARNTTWTLQRDTAEGIRFTGINYHDGQGFLARKSLGFRSTLELDGVSVCVESSTTSVDNLRDYFMLNRMKYSPVQLQGLDQVQAAFESGKCDVITTDQSGLYAMRTRFKDPAQAVVLPEIISKEPLGPAVRAGDDAWFNIVRWTLFVMIDAEEMEISSRNVDRVRENSTLPRVRRLLGLEGDYGRQMGLGEDWAYQIIRQVGNYAESFERNVGSASALNIGRGQNALWKDGGLLYAPPVQ